MAIRYLPKVGEAVYVRDQTTRRSAVAQVEDLWADVHGEVRVRVHLMTDWFDWAGTSPRVQEDGTVDLVGGERYPAAGTVRVVRHWEIEAVRF